jgi:hypothetical protein
VAATYVEAASPGAGVELVFWDHFDFRVAQGQDRVKGIHLLIKPGCDRFLIAQGKILGDALFIGNRRRTFPNSKTEPLHITPVILAPATCKFRTKIVAVPETLSPSQLPI